MKSRMNNRKTTAVGNDRGIEGFGVSMLFISAEVIRLEVYMIAKIINRVIIPLATHFQRRVGFRVHCPSFSINIELCVN